jgi:serine/threonine protein kinase
MKRLSLALLQEWKQYELFEREARVLASLRHPSIPRYVEHFELELPAGDAGVECVHGTPTDDTKCRDRSVTGLQSIELVYAYRCPLGDLTDVGPPPGCIQIPLGPDLNFLLACCPN